MALPGTRSVVGKISCWDINERDPTFCHTTEKSDIFINNLIWVLSENTTMEYWQWNAPLEGNGFSFSLSYWVPLFLYATDLKRFHIRRPWRITTVVREGVNSRTGWKPHCQTVCQIKERRKIARNSCISLTDKLNQKNICMSAFNLFHLYHSFGLWFGREQRCRVLNQTTKSNSSIILLR